MPVSTHRLKPPKCSPKIQLTTCASPLTPPTKTQPQPNISHALVWSSINMPSTRTPFFFAVWAPICYFFILHCSSAFVYRCLLPRSSNLNAKKAKTDLSIITNISHPCWAELNRLVLLLFHVSRRCVRRCGTPFFFLAALDTCFEQVCCHCAALIAINKRTEKWFEIGSVMIAFS